MDPSLDDSLTLEGMDFDHSEDVVNQEDITLEDTGRLGTISMDLDDIGEESQNLMEASNDEVIVSDLIEEPFPFQEYTVQCNIGDSPNILINANQMNDLTQLHTSSNLQTLLKAPAAPMSNVVSLKKVTKRVVATAPPRQVAIAPKPVQAKAVQYAIAPKPVTVVSNKHSVGTVKKFPISSDGKGNTVLAQFGKQLVMVPKKIKLMSSSALSGEGVLNTSSSSGLQYQMSLSPEQVQLLSNKPKPMLKFIQLSGKSGQSGAEQSANSATLTKLMPANVPGARYVMQQKKVPISIGGNKVMHNVQIAGKKQIIAIKSQSPQVVQVSQSQGSGTAKKVVISNANQKVMIRTSPSTSQAAKESARTGQHTQFHPINVPGKGIQYIKLVTNQPAKKTAPAPKSVPSKNFVFTDSKGNVIQMTAEKISQAPSVAIPGTVTGSNKGVVKTIKGQKKFVRIAPVSKTVTQSSSQPPRSSQSLLAPITAMTSLSSLDSQSETVSLSDLNGIEDETIEKSQSYNLSTFIDKHNYSEKYSNENDYSTEDFSINDYDTSNVHEETVDDEPDPDEAIDVKPLQSTLQSLISEAVGGGASDGEISGSQEAEIEYIKKEDHISNASFVLRDDSNLDASNTSGMHEESIIIVPGSYTDKNNESLNSDDSHTHRRLSEVSKKNIPLPAMSVEAECIPYEEHIMQQSPRMSDQEAAASLEMRPRKACNCTKSQCLKLYCDCFANGEFCNNCNCNNCQNNLENEEVRQKAIRACLERNPNAFRPKIGKAKASGPEIIRRHTKGCNCKRSGCLKNYCECYEAKIACTAMCKCVGCRNVEESLVRRRDAVRTREKLNDTAGLYRPAPQPPTPVKQPCNFITCEVIEAVCQCLLAAAGGEGVVEGIASGGDNGRPDPVHDVIEEFARCLQDVITASHHTL